MIYFLFGPDTYRSREALHGIIDEFSKKPEGPKPALFRINAEEDELESITREYKTPSFFGEKKLFVIENAIGGKKNYISGVTTFLDGWETVKDAVFIFVDGECDKSSAAFNEVKGRATKAQEFSHLTGSKLKSWFDEELAKRGIKVPESAKTALLEGSAGNLWRLNNELNKYEAGGEIVKNTEKNEAKIWDFTDSFFVKRGRSMAAAYRLLASGIDEIYLIASLGRSFRTIMSLVSIVKHKGDIQSAGKALDLHPYVLRKNHEIAKNVDYGVSLRAHRLLGEVDSNIKTGKAPASIAILNLFIRK